jgi:dienelactone hydrolase
MSDLREVQISFGPSHLNGTLTIPATPKGVILFAHGSGSSRLSPRNQQVARALNEEDYATLLMDLLTEAEEKVDRVTREHRFNIIMLSERLVTAIDWLEDNRSTRGLDIGLFGASTGAAAALIAASARPEKVGAVVSRGGRPDLARDALPLVEAPTLLLVGGYDKAVIKMNEDASNQMVANRELKVVPGASHLFEEPGKLEEVALMAIRWFELYLESEATV